ncbi:hypothetical protein L5515_018691 [Caenorhabditis briggsae]|uniref:Uncharacterized protein n=1 Tax=Caenorhabditis briggsae TaxID=6238 RepID=A0AAE9JUL2_CAEBR|nr:hypothetical protein L5515_018691 [Caenorhabditis briggsae]
MCPERFFFNQDLQEHSPVWSLGFSSSTDQYLICIATTHSVSICRALNTGFRLTTSHWVTTSGGHQTQLNSSFDDTIAATLETHGLIWARRGQDMKMGTDIKKAFGLKNIMKGMWTGSWALQQRFIGFYWQWQVEWNNEERSTNLWKTKTGPVS